MRKKLEEAIPKEWLGKERKSELIEILLPLFNVMARSELEEFVKNVSIEEYECDKGRDYINEV